MSNLAKIDFKADKIKLQTLFNNEELMNSFKTSDVQCDKIMEVYGQQVKFGAVPEDRPLNYAMYVLSMDGKIAYGTSVHGPYIAANNVLDPDGGDADFWMLSLTRAVSDATIKGANMLAREPKHTAHVFDPALVEARLKAGKPACPIHIIISLDGTDIPFEHRIFNEEEIPVMIITSPEGEKYIKETDGNNKPYKFFGFNQEAPTKEAINSSMFTASDVVVISAGEGRKLNNTNIMKALRYAGIEYCTIESPVYTHVLLKESMMDEMWLNYSMVYSGGEGRSLGENMPGFTHLEHPHGELITLQMHSPAFLYARFKMHLGLVAPELAMK